MGIAIYQVDAFTEEPFRGNPAAVCILPEPDRVKEHRDESENAWKKHFQS
jgi:predicted PhzF superfamily epimerase YddE/YHI9